LKIKLTFLGAAGNVTGSCFLLETSGKRVLIDCGLFQEWELKSRNWQFPVPPGSIDAILLTHAHLDHSGRIPKLVKDGFRGKIYCTGVTIKLAKILLEDAGHIQEEDAINKAKRHEKEGRKGPNPELPLYTAEDATRTLPLFESVTYNEPVEIGNGITATFHDAGHVLGSAMIKVHIREGGEDKCIVFSGDIGRWNAPILRDPSVFERAHYVLVESTYANRRHDSLENIKDELTEVILSTLKAGGNLLVPSFALERTQEFLYYLRELRNEKRIPMMVAFLDSPMAIGITEIFNNHTEYFDKETMAVVDKGLSPFEFAGLKTTRTIEESKTINSIKGTVIIIAGSGMCTGGRIKHHLAANLARPESTVLFIGYQAGGTLGRQILDGADKVRLFGKYLPVYARVAHIDGFSAHADKDGLVKWLSAFKSPPRRVFVVHGEPEAAAGLGSVVKEQMGWNAYLPAYLEETVLD
jgi:metallo-beta-lactamase family protein